MEEHKEELEAASVISEEERQELQAFMKEHGIVSIEERAEGILETLQPDERNRFEENEKELGAFEYAITHTERIERLKGLFQLGGKQIPNESPAAGIVAIPAFHTRFNHSEMAALNAKVIGARLDFPIGKIKLSVAAAWLHDVGHSAFSHAGDGILVEKGLPSHEERGAEIIKRDKELGKVLQGLDLNEIEKIIHEENAQGELQSAIDTISYLDMDVQMLQIPKQIDLPRLLSDIKKVDEEKRALVVENPDLWKQMLEARIKMMGEFYYNRRNKISEQALQQLMRIAFNQHELNPKEVAEGTDYDIRRKLQALVQFDPYKAARLGMKPVVPRLRAYKDLYTMSLGFEVDGWAEVECQNKEEAMRVLATASHDALTSSFVVSPYDYTQKRLRIIDAKDLTENVQTIRGAEGLSAAEQKYVVCFKKTS